MQIISLFVINTYKYKNTGIINIFHDCERPKLFYKPRKLCHFFPQKNNRLSRFGPVKPLNIQNIDICI